MSDNNKKNMACSTKPDWWQTVMLWRDDIDETKSDDETPASQQLNTLLQTTKQLPLLILQKAYRGDGMGVLEDVRAHGLREWRIVELNLLYEVMGKLRVDIWKQYSSSIGALGCKLNTNRVAYWPEPVTCDNICVKVSNAGRSVHLLRVDQSGGAHDVSYDAWNYLAFGTGAVQDPHEGGGIAMAYEQVHPDECRSLLHDGKLALSAANSMNYIESCLGGKNWVAENHKLVNLLDPGCRYGWDEPCTLDLSKSNQAACPHTLGDAHTPTGQKVTNIRYRTGEYYVAQ
ncbi:S-adenosylmethionine-dependent methyltransferase-like protein [Purpureocillium lavendulum]|uniref:S-adenosylmethionine-dependent methyltransferase-like protein n=1 Tax=Purpureocillium lavendulum TaxID=1247861 RepID=A0AB34FCT4_9HYPO|nr:S-adenosylmethionine-dependent methyltransferase-like protein [Purpureocillium lavendulum]